MSTNSKDLILSLIVEDSVTVSISNLIYYPMHYLVYSSIETPVWRSIKNSIKNSVKNSVWGFTAEKVNEYKN
jgi:hypothetical protein